MEAKSLHSLHSTVEVIKQQVIRDHFGSFLFSFIADSILNLTAKRLLFVGNIFSIIYIGCAILCNITICYHASPTLNFDVTTFENLKKIAGFFFFTPGSVKRTGDILHFAPFYGQILLTVMSTISYISFHLYYLYCCRRCCPIRY